MACAQHFMHVAWASTLILNNVEHDETMAVIWEFVPAYHGSCRAVWCPNLRASLTAVEHVPAGHKDVQRPGKRPARKRQGKAQEHVQGTLAVQEERLRCDEVEGRHEFTVSAPKL